MPRAVKAVEKHLRSAREAVQLDPHVQHLLGGAFSVHGQQQYRGLSLYPHSMVMIVEADGRVSSTGDPVIPIRDLDVVPSLESTAAARVAFGHVRMGTGDACHTAHEPSFEERRYRPRVVAAFPMPNRPTVLTRGPFHEPVQANLVLFSGEAPPVLAWLVVAAAKNVADFTILVAASGNRAGEVLYCTAEAASATCIASVFPFSAGEQARDIPFPRPIADYPPGIRPSTPFRDWVTADQLDGNNALLRIGTRNSVVPSVVVNAVRRFTPAAGSPEQQAVNAFFVCNFMHDFFSLIGFGEADGNFQQQNFSGSGRTGDRLVVSIVTSAQGNANMRAQNDGSVAELTLGRWRDFATGAVENATALDTGVVIHEFAHGVSQRLVSGRLKRAALNEPQPLALGEAWSDYFAVSILNFYRGNARRFTFAEFASGNAAGARPHPYDAFPSNVSSLGTAPFHEQHGAGSIFAAALIEMHEQLRALFNDDDRTTATGQETSWRLVVDSMKQLNANPTFIDARDALLRSNTRLALPQAAAIETRIRAAFAKFGMGRTASCRNTSLRGFQRVDFNP